MPDQKSDQKSDQKIFREKTMQQFSSPEELTEELFKAYLGSLESNDSNVDMFYFRNLTEENLEADFSLTYENEEESFTAPCYLDPGQEGMLLSYRMTDVDRDGRPAKLQLRVKDLVEELTVTIMNPPEE